MAEFNQDTYQPESGDLYIQEVKAGRFTIYRYSFGSWEQLGAGHSEQDIKKLVEPMQFLGENKGKRQYYRPDEARRAAMAELIDKAELGTQLRAELFEGGKVLLTSTQDDPFLPTFIELDAKAAMLLFDFLLLHQKRLIRHRDAAQQAQDYQDQQNYMEHHYPGGE